MEVRPIDRNQSIVDAAGNPTQNFQVGWEQVRRLTTLVGTGSPEGAVIAQEGRFYLSQGDYPALYVKKLNDIAGDRSLGWMMVSGSYYISEQRFQDFTDQVPPGLDAPTVVKYGPAVTSPNGFVSVTAGGIFQVLKGGPYLLKSNLRVSRLGAGGASHIHLWVETSADGVTYTPANVSLRITIDSSVTDDHLYDSSPAFLPAGLYVRTMMARSSTGSNSGGLYHSDPSASLASYGVGPDPSASLEWHIMTGYNYE